MNFRKRSAEGGADTCIQVWGIGVCTVRETFTLHSAETLRAQERLASADFDPPMTRIPLKRAQELRGKLEHWSVRNIALATVTKYVGKLLVASAGVISPRGSLSELKKPIIDYWGSLETIRIHLLTGSSIRQSYSSSYPLVLALGELLSFPEVQTSLVWLGSDETPAQCDDVDFADTVFARFPFFDLRPFRV